jgi:multiple sugar transport system substrate-binding protein
MRSILAATLLTYGATTCKNESTASSGVTTVEWFIGIGTGADPEQVSVERKIVRRFNAHHKTVKIKMTVTDSGTGATVFAKRLKDGNPPDLIGPVGISASTRFAEDFAPIDASMMKLEGFPADQLNAYRTESHRLLGIPIGVAPAIVYYNKDLFDRLGMPYLPQRPGETYRGKPWDFDNLRETAQLLTLDAEGRHAGEADFNPATVVQWGFHDLFVNEARSLGAEFGSGSLIAADGTAQIPEPWLAQWTWYHEMVWTDHSVPNGEQVRSAVLGGGNPFASGKVAMTVCHSWNAPSLIAMPPSGRLNWDFAIMPAYRGQVTSRAHVDSFRIMKTEHSRAAQTVLAYLTGAALEELSAIYGQVPVRNDLRTSYLERSAEASPMVSWQVVVDSLPFGDRPSFETALPHEPQVAELTEAFYERLVNDPGMNVRAAAEELKSELNLAFVAAPTAPRTKGG